MKAVIGLAAVRHRVGQRTDTSVIHIASYDIAGLAFN